MSENCLVAWGKISHIELELVSELQMLFRHNLFSSPCSTPWHAHPCPMLRFPSMFLPPKLPIQPSSLNSGCVYPTTSLTLPCDYHKKMSKTKIAINTHLLPQIWASSSFPCGNKWHHHVFGFTSQKYGSHMHTCRSLIHHVQPIKAWLFYPLNLSRTHPLLTFPHHTTPQNSLFFISALFFFTHRMISLFVCCSRISTWLDSKLHRDRIVPGM